jgi:hypothetical protein
MTAQEWSYRNTMATLQQKINNLNDNDPCADMKYQRYAEEIEDLQKKIDSLTAA